MPASRGSVFTRFPFCFPYEASVNYSQDEALLLTQSLIDALDLPIQSLEKNLRIPPNAQWGCLTFGERNLRVQAGSSNEHAKRGEVGLLESHMPMRIRRHRC